MNSRQIYRQGDYIWDQKSFIGQGSFAKVYKCKCLKDNQQYAVKVIDMSNFTDKQMQDSLKNEINIMKQLKGENIVHLVEHIYGQKETYLFIEYCEGGDLRKYINKKGGKLNEMEAIIILNQLMRGFQELISKGYIHRDIKPQNCLIKNNIFKIADFGFATKADLKGRKLLKDCVGTPLYMAPQLLENSSYTAKSDLWSIGMMFYEMLFAKTPWPARDINSFLLNINTCSLRFPYDKPIGVQTKDFLVRCLTIDEKKRIGWDEVFTHPILRMESGKVDLPEIVLDQKSKLILRSLQKIVQNNNLNIINIFNKFDFDGGGSLDQQEFFILLKMIDKKIIEDEANYVFKIVDSSKDGKVSLLEFSNIFCKYDFSDIEDRVENIITDLKEIIKANNLKLKQMFVNFDYDKYGSLDRIEFENLIKIVAPALKNDEIEQCFDKFDINKDGTISFDEFVKALTNEETNKDDASILKAKRIISELKKTCKQNNIDTNIIFNNITKKKEQFLDFNQFEKLIKIIDKNITQEDLKVAFQIFDINNDGKIDSFEFNSQLK